MQTRAWQAPGIFAAHPQQAEFRFPGPSSARIKLGGNRSSQAAPDGLRGHCWLSANDLLTRHGVVLARCAMGGYVGSNSRALKIKLRRHITLGMTRIELSAISCLGPAPEDHSCVGAAAAGAAAGATSCPALSLAISRCSSVARSSRMRSCSVRR